MAPAQQAPPQPVPNGQFTHGPFFEVGPRFAVEYPVWWFVSAFAEVGTGIWQHGKDFNQPVQDIIDATMSDSPTMPPIYDFTSIGFEGGVKTFVGVESGVGYHFTMEGSRAFLFVEGGLIGPHMSPSQIGKNTMSVLSSFKNAFAKGPALLKSTTPGALHSQMQAKWGASMSLKSGLLGLLPGFVETGWSGFVTIWRSP